MFQTIHAYPRPTRNALIAGSLVLLMAMPGPANAASTGEIVHDDRGYVFLGRIDQVVVARLDGDALDVTGQTRFRCLHVATVAGPFLLDLLGHGKLLPM